MTTRGRSKQAASSVLETPDVSSSESENEFLIGGTPVKPRPKLRTRRVVSAVASRITDIAHHRDDAASNSSEVMRPPKRRRQVAKIDPSTLKDADEDNAEEEDQDDTETYQEQVEEPSEEEHLPEEDLNRRRSGRARKRVQPVIDLSEDDFMASSDASEEEKPKPARKKNGKGKQKRKRAASSDESDASMDSDDDNFVQIVENTSASVSDGVDGFVIDKILAHESHTMKEWKKMCANKNTRFLTDCSIFLPDEDQETKEEDVETDKDKTADVAAAEKGEAEGEAEDEGEERFLVKWKKLSYLHTSWQTEKDLLETDKNAKGKIQRFLEKELRSVYSPNVQGDEYFNPEFRIVDRILEIRDRPQDDFAPDDESTLEGEKKRQYFLVKWKALSYDDITWERESDVGDDAAVQLYNERIMRAAKRFKKIALAKHTPSHTNKRKLHFRGYTAESPPPYKESQSFQLRDYQLTGVNWMLFNWYQKRNSMLADEMGLGKTVQTVMYINHLAVVEQTPRPFIIVAPLSTLGHWQREFDSWTDLNAVVYHGSASAREVLQNYEFFLSEDELARAEELAGKRPANGAGKRSSPRPKRNCYRFDVLITTYEMASAMDLSKLARIDWQLMVVDEAHRLKNRNSKLSTILHSKFTYENMLLLTGTPLQNNVEELWVLLNFLDDSKFASKEDFLASFGELTDSAQVERLHSELKPYLLRRMKEDVEKSLAPKEETIIEVELTVLQKQYYRAIYERNTEFLSRGGKKGNAPSLMNVLMELRKCCNHPFLVKGVEEREAKRLSQQKTETKDEIQRQIRESLVTSSGKLVLLDKLLPRLKDTDHRVLIFSQFKIMLDIIQDYLLLRQYNCERIDGNITGNDRQSAIDRFCREGSNAFIMLLSTRAGGVGINLTAADTVIIYDSDWNPQNDLQAQARCHRIGQKKSVKIYRLLTSKTYELHMFHQASLKLGLDQAVLGGIRNNDPAAKLKGGTKTSNPNARMTKEEIENLLKHGAYEMFKEHESEAEAASSKFGEESIDQILSRSTTIVHDPTRDADGTERKNAMSSFSKATFVSSANPDEEVDIDDPNFWTKVIGLNGVEEQKPVEPSPLKKRRCRRKVKSYLMQDDSGDENSASARKQLSWQRELAKDNEEYTISDDEEESDDDEGDEGLVKDDFLTVASEKKRKRSRTPKVPLFVHTERIADLLATYGYGRWDDMTRHTPALHAYPQKELKRFVQQYLTGLLRVTTALPLFQRIGLELEPNQVYMVSNTPPTERVDHTSPIGSYAFELNSACRRYRFAAAMLKDMKVTNILSIPVPPRMWKVDLAGRGSRTLRPKLQQIETMFKLSQFVRLKFVPTTPLINLINDLQRVGDEATVRRMIESGTLPAIKPSVVSARSDAAVASTSKTEVPASGETKVKGEALASEATEVTEPTPAVSENAPKAEALKQVETVIAEVAAVLEARTSEGANATEPTPTVSENSPTAEAAPKQEEPTVVEVAAGLEAPTCEANEASPTTQPETPKETAVPAEGSVVAPAEASTSKSPLENAVAPVTSISETPSESTPTTDTSTSEPVSESTATTSASTSDATLLQETEKVNIEDVKPPLSLDTASAEDKVREDVMVKVKDEAELSASRDVSSTVSSTTPGSMVEKELADKLAADKLAADNLAAKQQAERQQAMKVLQSLPVVNFPEMVAPWWIGGVDDALLMMYVCRDGWIKGRFLPSQLQSSSLFGDRAHRHPLPEWPTVAGLNRRLKLLIQSWTAVKKPRPLLPVATSIAAALGVSASSAQRQQQLHQQHEQRAYQARQYSASFHGSRHNQFAKLVFSYGIPDVSTCHDEHEQREKWRYFLNDGHLDVAHQPLEALLAEALDLERVCRQRLRSDGGTSTSEAIEENSVLGGKRGFWLLTTTQCRRLLHRVDLFRMLRTQILVLPPAQLVEVVTRVVRAQPTSTEYPVWWSSPRHDILLLQGVECYGLDEHLPAVWKLPVFNSANTVSPFPNVTWVENYVTALAVACRNLLGKVRAFRNPNSGHASASAHGNGGERPRQHQRAAVSQEASETRRRIRDIRGMREEDPYFAPAVRLRQLIESNTARDQITAANARLEALQAAAERRRNLIVQPPGATPADETAQMQQEDPYVSERVRQMWIGQIKRDEIEAVEQRVVMRSARHHGVNASPPGEAEVIHLENDDDESTSAAGAAERSSSSSSRSESIAHTPAAAAVAAAKAERQQAAARSWDVIVIDDSDSDASD